MKTPLSWLREYVEITVSPDELAHRLTMAGTEVESVQRTHEWDCVVVGEVRAVVPHPNADRLTLVTVFNGESELQVVCGAPNVAEGQKIAFASVGAELIDPYADEPGTRRKLKRSKIRGSVSEGMVCSEKELGLSGKHEGILVLETGRPPGTPLADVLGDTVLDLELTPNRPDCLGMLGVAREVAAVTGGQVTVPDVTYEETGPPVDSLAQVIIEDPDLCPRYTASVIQGATIGPSPKWLADRLLAIGERPVNNVVDITNYVMFEFGQPLHAFDYDRVQDHKVIVRRARQDEKIVTLDGRERELDGEMLLIADPGKGIGLAGVMGGENTEISSSTTTIFLESATFNGTSNRRTARVLGLRSQATLRFEKGLRSGLSVVALRRATKLILEIAGGTAARGIIDEFPGESAEQRTVELTREKLKRVLGVDIEHDLVVRTLESLGFEVDSNGSGWVVDIPYWRPDITIPEDVVEEVARIVGYDSIPTVTPSGRIQPWEPRPETDLQRTVTDSLARAGMQEMISYSATTPESESRTGQVNGDGEPLRLANPVTADFTTMRRTLREAVLNAVARNLRTWRGPIAMFELGRVFHFYGEGQPEEKLMAVGAFAGPASEPHWSGRRDNFDFYDAKGVVEAALADLRLDAVFAAADDPTFVPGRAAAVTASSGGSGGGVRVGVVGEVRAEVLEAFGINGTPVAMFELDLRPLGRAVSRVTPENVYAPYIKYQDSERDLALLVDSAVGAGDVAAVARRNRLVTSATVFDVYEGKGVPDGKKSLAVRIVYQSPKKTLTADDLAKAEGSILRTLEKELGATLRV